MTRKPQSRKPKPAPQTETIDNTSATVVDGPAFAQPQPTPDPKKFEITHPSDGAAYKQIDELNREHKLAPLPFPAPRGLPEPTLSLAAVLDVSEAALEKQIAKSGQIVFHATGDTGSTRGPESQNLVADKMVADFTDDDADRPLFFFHLGDVIYSFGERPILLRSILRAVPRLSGANCRHCRQSRRHGRAGHQGRKLGRVPGEFLRREIRSGA